jgi:hypothetical protein
MAIEANPERCPTCAIGASFTYADYRRSTFPLWTHGAVWAVLLIGIAGMAAGFWFARSFLFDLQVTHQWRRREAGLLFLISSILIIGGGSWGLSRAVLWLRSGPRLFRCRCTDCQAVHDYWLQYAPTVDATSAEAGTGTGSESKDQTVVPESTDDLAALPSTGQSYVYELDVNDPSLERIRRAERRARIKRRGDPAINYNPELDFTDPPPEDPPSEDPPQS